jgi:VWFA-related protein
MTSTSTGRVLLCSVLLLAPSGHAAPEKNQQVPSFASEVELITVDAVVVDEAGRPVAGLTRDDFVVKEDGRPQTIASFEAFAAEAGAGEGQAALPGVVATNEGGVGPGRVFGILVDDLGITAPVVQPTRQALASFLETSLRDGDEVTVATTSGDAFWSARLPEGRPDLLAVLKRLRGEKNSAREMAWMTDYEAYWIANHQDSPAFADSTPSGDGRSQPLRATSSSDANHPGGQRGPKTRVVQRWLNLNVCLASVCESMVRNRAVEIDAQRRARLGLTLQALRRQIEAFAPIRGRKSILFLSEGFLDDGGRELRDLVAASREANAAIYFVDVNGLTASAEHETAASFGTLEDPRDQTAMGFEARNLADAGSVALAEESGGAAIRNTNDLDSGVARIADESRVFYLLGFYPPEGKSEREWRKLRVEVTKKGLTVRARRGYTLRPASVAEGRKDSKKKGKDKEELPAAVSHALDTVHPLAGVPLRAMSYVFEPRQGDLTHVVVAVEVDAGHLAYTPRGSSKLARLEVTAVAVNRDTGRGFRHDDTADVAVKGAEAPGWRSLVREFELPAGVTQVRVVARDLQSGALGSVTQRLEVPEAGSLRLSTPILSDHLAPTENPGDKPRPALSASRSFEAKGALYCQFEVFGASMAASGGGQVSAGLEVRGPGGEVLRHAPPTPIAVDASGRLIRVLGLGLEGLAEGSYDLVLQVEDQLGGGRMERREPFEIVRAGS